MTASIAPARRHLTVRHTAVLLVAFAAQRIEIERYEATPSRYQHPEEDVYRWTAFSTSKVAKILLQRPGLEVVAAGPRSPLRYLRELVAIGLLDGYQYRPGGQWEFRCLLPKWRALRAEVLAELKPAEEPAGEPA